MILVGAAIPLGHHSGGMTGDHPSAEPIRTLFEGQHIRLVRAQRWEYVERHQVSGIVAVIGITSDEKIVLTEQYRIPVGHKVIELPAGLAGDIPGAKEEKLEIAAQRELLEETGYVASEFTPLTTGPPSAGISSEIITLFWATGLRRVGAGGGAHGEQIAVHEVALGQAHNWLLERQREGLLIDPKVFAGLYFASMQVGHAP